MKSLVIKGNEALIRGMDIMVDTVASSLGPRGKLVAIAHSTPNGTIYSRSPIRDGVKIAKSIDLENEFENMGAQLLAEASKRQVDQSGDSTTAVQIVAAAIVHQALQVIATGVHPTSLHDGLLKGLKKLQAELLKQATQISTHKELAQIATIASNDAELGEMIADIFDLVGKDGVITVEATQAAHTSFEHTTGVQWDRGWANQFLVSNPDTMEATLINPYIFLTDRTLFSFASVLPLVDQAIKQNHSLVFVAPDFAGDFLPNLINNKLRAGAQLLAIKAPGFGDDQKQTLQDFALLTGGKFLSEDSGVKFEDVTFADLGRSESVTSTKNETIIAGGVGVQEDVDARMESIKKDIETEESDFNVEKLKQRLARFTNGVVVVRAGGYLESEQKERAERIDDALCSARQALNMGVIVGGERAYLNIRHVLDQKDVAENILYKALEKPYKKLLENADIAPEDMAVQLAEKAYVVDEDTHKQFGVNVVSGKVENLVESGILDAVACPYFALQNAVSVAIEIITIGHTIIPDIPNLTR